jgi:hypothetical protein
LKYDPWKYHYSFWKFHHLFTVNFIIAVLLCLYRVLLLTVVSVCCRPRRRSGSSIVVVDTQEPEPIKHRTPEEQEAEDAYNMMMTLDNGPHREMAVDVPDSFIARSKTPPRYPPPRSQCRLQVYNFCSLIILLSSVQW